MIKKSKMVGISMRRAYCNGAVFKGVIGRMSIFTSAVLVDANFEEADLDDANFEYATLIRTNFLFVKRNGAKFAGAATFGAIF